jgi:hypothetical protein
MADQRNNQVRRESAAAVGQLRALRRHFGDVEVLEPDELRRTVEDHPLIAEVVGIAAEEAARSASDDKRYLLAQVVAAALRGDATLGRSTPCST